jgi:hypothetical protein
LAVDEKYCNLGCREKEISVAEKEGLICRERGILAVINKKSQL